MIHNILILAAMRQAFDAAWGGIRAHEPEDNKKEAEDGTLVGATEGITDADSATKAIAKWSR